MSGEHPELVRLRHEAAALDDDALVALANRGLLRRARRALEGEHARIEVDGAGTVEVLGDDWAVEVASDTPLVRGRCGCATAGICVHLVIAILTLADGADPSAGTPVGPVAEASAAGVWAAPAALEAGGTAIVRSLCSITDDALRRWSSTPGLRWAIDRLAAMDDNDAEVELSAIVHVRLPSPLPTVRFVSSDLDAVVVDPPGRHDRRVGALAILLLWRSDGRPPPTLPSRAPTARERNRERERPRVLDHTVLLTERAIDQGLTHLGPGFVAHLDALASETRGTDLHRLARLADRAADLIDAIERHDAAADTAELLELLSSMATLAAWTRSCIERGEPVPDAVVGSARARYEPIGDLDLIGGGDLRWGDATFGGRTELAIDATGPRVFTVSRPDRIGGRPQSGGPAWTGAEQATLLAGTRFRLADARASQNHRLSTSATTAFIATGKFAAADLEPSTWDGTVPPPASRLFDRTGKRWVVVAVEDAEPEATFDPIVQRASWAIQSRGVALSVDIAFGPTTATTLTALVDLVPRRPTHVIGQLDATTPDPTIRPVSLVIDGALEVLDRAGQSGLMLTAGRFDHPTITSFDRIEAAIIRLAERGTGSPDDTAFRSLAQQAHDHGFGPIGTVVADGTIPHHRRLLRAGWLLAEYRMVDARS